MAIYEITTLEQSGKGGEYASHYLFDRDRILLIANYGKENAYVSRFNSEIAKVLGLVDIPDHMQRNEEIGWSIKHHEKKIVKMTQPDFDNLVESLSKVSVGVFIGSRGERRVA